MANQHRSAFDEAIADHAAILKQHKIKASAAKGTLTYRDIVKPVRQYTTKKECNRLIKNLVAYAKKVELKELQDEQQSTLL